MTAVWDDPAVRRGMQLQAEALRHLREQGAEQIGWKVGVGAPAAMQAAGIAAPLVGFLTSRTVIDDGSSISLRGMTNPVLEPEIAIVMAADVAGDASTAEAAAAIGAVAPAIEVADIDHPLDQLTAVVGGNIFHRAVLLGDAETHRPSGDVDDLRVSVRRGREPAAQTDAVTSLTGSPEDLVVHVARWLAAAGLVLQRGQVIIGGSVVPPISVATGDEITYRCEPLGALGVRFTE